MTLQDFLGRLMAVTSYRRASRNEIQITSEEPMQESWLTYCSQKMVPT